MKRLKWSALILKSRTFIGKSISWKRKEDGVEIAEGVVENLGWMKDPDDTLICTLLVRKEGELRSLLIAEAIADGFFDEFEDGTIEIHYPVGIFTIKSASSSENNEMAFFA